MPAAAGTAFSRRAYGGKRRLAFHAADRLDSGSGDPAADAVRARIRRLEAKETGRHVEAGRLWRTLLARAAANDHCDDDPVRVRLCRRFRGDPNDAAANRRRPARYAADDRRGASAAESRGGQAQGNQGRHPGTTPRRRQLAEAQEARKRPRPSRSGAATFSAGRKSAGSPGVSCWRCCCSSCRAAP